MCVYSCLHLYIVQKGQKSSAPLLPLDHVLLLSGIPFTNTNLSSNIGFALNILMAMLSVPVYTVQPMSVSLLTFACMEKKA